MGAQLPGGKTLTEHTKRLLRIAYAIHRVRTAIPSHDWRHGVLADAAKLVGDMVAEAEGRS